MGDSVSCTMNSAHEFTCEVQIDSDFDAGDAIPAPSTSPPQALPEPNPAVSTLVSSFGSKTVVPPPNPPLFTAATLKECASSELGVALAGATGVKNPYLAVLTMLKAGFDTGM